MTIPSRYPLGENHMVPNPDGSQTPAEIQAELVRAIEAQQAADARLAQTLAEAYERDGQ